MHRMFKLIFLDKAGYYQAKAIKAPQNICLVYLPSSNPKLNLAERFWGDMKAKVAFHNFKQAQELEEWVTAATKACGQRQIASLNGYPYILDAICKITPSME